MEKVSRWVMICVLGYIGVVLTSINQKMDQMELQGAEFAVLDEVKNQSFDSSNPGETLIAPASRADFHPAIAAMAFIAIIGIFVTWNIARLYHDRRWSRQILNKSYSDYREPVVQLRPEVSLHRDQDSIFETPFADGRINGSWLPRKAHKLYEGWGSDKS